MSTYHIHPSEIQVYKYLLMVVQHIASWSVPDTNQIAKFNSAPTTIPNPYPDSSTPNLTLNLTTNVTLILYLRQNKDQN